MGVGVAVALAEGVTGTCVGACTIAVLDMLG